MKNFFLYLTLGIMATAFTWHVVLWSEQYGKLALPPDYDDSHSLVEGAVRLLNFQNGGLETAWEEYRHRNPHSFLHYYWTAVLFAFFGIHESVPYWANALFLLGVLGAFVSMLPRGLPSLWKLVWAGAFLGIPVCFHVVFDFRSEVTMAALLFMGCACALEWSWGKTRPAAWFFATAACFALALAMKPVMFPYQLGMLGLCSMVYLSSRCISFDQGGKLEGRKPALCFGKLGNGVAWLLALWLLVVLPSVPHFWIYWEDILGYISGVAFKSDYYKLGEAQGAQWSFHWLGYSGVWHLGALNIILAILLAAGIFCRAVPALKNFAPDARWCSLAFLVVGSFAGIAINSVHQPWFGMTFQLLLSAAGLSFLASLFLNPKIGIVAGTSFAALLGAMWLFIPVNQILIVLICLGLLLCDWVINREKKSLPVCLAVGAFCSLVLLYAYSVKGVMLQMAVAAVLLAGIAAVFRMDRKHWFSFASTGLIVLIVWTVIQRAPYHNYVDRTIREAGENGLEWRKLGPRTVLEVIISDWKEKTKVPIIWSAQFGWVDGNTLSWEAVKQGLAWKIYNMGTNFSLRKGIDNNDLFPDFADYVVIQSPGITGEIETPAGIKDWKTLISNKSNWDLVDGIKAPEGEVSVYRNSTKIEKRDFSQANAWIIYQKSLK